MANAAALVWLFSSTGEATWGSTAGTPTRKLHGITAASMTANTQVEVTDAVGWIGPSPIAAEVAQSGEGSIEGVLCYEEFPSLLNGVFTAISASATTAAPYSFQYTAPTNSTQVCYTYVVEAGYSTANAYRGLGGILNGVNVKGEAPGSWKFAAPLLFKNIINSTGGMTTSANVDRTINPIRMKDTTLSIDPFSTGTFGGTAVSATLINFELDVPAGRHVKQFAGSKFPGGWGDGEMNGTLSVTLEFNATVKGYVDSILGSTGSEWQKHIRIYGTQSSSQQTATIDFAGILSEPVKLWDDRDGNLIVSMKLAGKNSTGLASGNWLQITATHGSSSTT